MIGLKSTIKQTIGWGDIFMRRISIILLMIIINCNYFFMANSIYNNEIPTISINSNLTPMEALDMVKEVYAHNFVKNSLPENNEDYFYKLDFADYYLVYEGIDDDSDYYLIHLYEFVLDDEETGLGHTVTYGWYRVNQCSGEIEVYPED